MTLLVLIASSLLTFLVGKDFASRSILSSQQNMPEQSEVMAQFGSFQTTSLRPGFAVPRGSTRNLGGWLFQELPLAADSEKVSDDSVLRVFSSDSSSFKDSLFVPKDIVSKDGEIFEIEFKADQLGSYVLRFESQGVSWLYAVRSRERQPLSFFPASEFEEGLYQLSIQKDGLRLGKFTLVDLDVTQALVRLNTNLEQYRFSKVIGKQFAGNPQVSQNEISAE